MILHRLYELAVRDKLIGDPAFRSLPIPFFLQVDDGGLYRGISDRREKKMEAKGRSPKLGPGPELSVPRAHGNAATQGFARFFADTLPRVVPMTRDLAGKSGAQDELAKRGRSRDTFWSQIDQAADATNDPALRAVQAFGRQLASDPALVARVEDDLAALRAKPTDRCTFLYHPDQGAPILDRESIRRWYSAFYGDYVAGRQADGPTGFCQVSRTVGPIPSTHPVKLQVPGWMSMGVSLVSYDKAAFESYGLEGTANASVGYDAADAYGAALKALIQRELPGRPESVMRLGENLALYWTRDPLPDDNGRYWLDNPDPETVASLLKAAHEGESQPPSPDANQFYMLTLSSNAARVIVRDYLEIPLPEVIANLGAWFRDLCIADTHKDRPGVPFAAFSVRSLALGLTPTRAGSQPDWNRVNDLIPRLLATALRHDPLPDSVLATLIGRFRSEGKAGFRTVRMALLKLALIRKEIPVSENLDPQVQTPAYVCGRLLELFGRIQYAALGDVRANVIDKYYGGFSAAPLTVLGSLFENAQNHLRTLRTEKPALATSLENELAHTTKLLDKHSLTTVPFNLADQAILAIGYYHAKAARLERAAAKKREKQLKDEQSRAD